ncbi:larval cuticle protein LCP-17-like [Penaeus indicus]|uniref:larval cuticle protein LCP-17-like n=1 Tax=Penaeus indicus TaxID=29960 RepID=UPI00300CDCE0
MPSSEPVPMVEIEAPPLCLQNEWSRPFLSAQYIKVATAYAKIIPGDLLHSRHEDFHYHPWAVTTLIEFCPRDCTGRELCVQNPQMLSVSATDLVIVLACLAAVAVAAPQLEERVVELLRDDRVANEDGTFSYALEADNGIKTAVSGSIGAEGQINQEGSYTFILEDGTQAIVSFVANENGFQPQSSILPTPHPLPEHVFELLEIAERQRAEGIVFE